MNKVIASCLSLFLLAGVEGLKANPAVNISEGDMLCSVTVTSHLAGPSTTPAHSAPRSAIVLQTVEITRLGKFQRDEMTWSDGKKTEAWTLLDQGMTLAERIVGGSSFIYELQKDSPIRNVLCPTLLDLDESSILWINAQSFTGKADLESKPTFHYQKEISLPTPNAPPRVVVYQAWVDAKTLIPLAFDDGDALYDLSFSAPPAGTGPLVLPARFQKDFQEYENANAKIRHL